MCSKPPLKLQCHEKRCKTESLNFGIHEFFSNFLIYMLANSNHHSPNEVDFLQLPSWNLNSHIQNAVIHTAGGHWLLHTPRETWCPKLLGRNWQSGASPNWERRMHTIQNIFFLLCSVFLSWLSLTLFFFFFSFFSQKELKIKFESYRSYFRDVFPFPLYFLL